MNRNQVEDFQEKFHNSKIKGRP